MGIGRHSWKGPLNNGWLLDDDGSAPAEPGLCPRQKKCQTLRQLKEAVLEVSIQSHKLRFPWQQRPTAQANAVTGGRSSRQKIKTSNGSAKACRNVNLLPHWMCT